MPKIMDEMCKKMDPALAEEMREKARDPENTFAVLISGAKSEKELSDLREAIRLCPEFKFLCLWVCEKEVPCPIAQRFGPKGKKGDA